MDDNDTICRKFLENPKVNPQTGKILQKGKGPYMKYIQICRDLGYNEEVDKLLSGVVVSPKVIKSPKPNTKSVAIPVNTSPIQSQLTGNLDVDKYIIINLDLDSLLNLIKTNKKLRKFIYDNLLEIVGQYKSKQYGYHLLVYFTSKLLIMGELDFVRRIIQLTKILGFIGSPWK